MPELEIADVRLTYETAGSAGDPLVLVHDAWDDRRVWRRLVPALSASFQLLSYDRRGHGESTGPARRSPVRDDVGDLARLLERSDLYPAHVVGLGYGGSVAFRLAGERPELVRSVLVHEPPFGPTDPNDRQDPAASAQGPADPDGVEGPPEAYLEQVAAPGERWPGWEYAGTGVGPRVGRSGREELRDPEAKTFPGTGDGEFLLPVLATAGARSPEPAARLARSLEERLRNSLARLLPGAGHWAPYYEPDLYAGVLVDFLLERNVPST